MFCRRIDPANVTKIDCVGSFYGFATGTECMDTSQVSEGRGHFPHSLPCCSGAYGKSACPKAPRPDRRTAAGATGPTGTKRDGADYIFVTHTPFEGRRARAPAGVACRPRSASATTRSPSTRGASARATTCSVASATRKCGPAPRAQATPTLCLIPGLPAGRAGLPRAALLDRLARPGQELDVLAGELYRGHALPQHVLGDGHEGKVDQRDGGALHCRRRQMRRGQPEQAVHQRRLHGTSWAWRLPHKISFNVRKWRLQEVPCDNVLDGSTAVVDKCGVCNGDGTRCALVEGDDEFVKKHHHGKATPTVRLFPWHAAGFQRSRWWQPCRRGRGT